MKLPNKCKTPLIRCPHCFREYLPGEIYMPGDLIGQPQDIVRDTLGKIIYEDYGPVENEPTLVTHYVCDECEKPFVVEASVSYRVKEEAPELDFSNKYVSLLD
jgi:DNA-directed RNA polymerase subunit RPC12/RpoP